MSVRTLQHLYPDAILPRALVKSLVHRLLFAINWLHVEGNVIHTDISPQNVLTEAPDDSVFQYIEEQESQKPSIPSIVGNHPVYPSRAISAIVSGFPILTDFGQMRPADPINTGWWMPDLYRAPEVLLQIPWDYPVDLWSLGIMILELLEGKNGFDPIDRVHNQYVTPLALSQYIGLLGPPPLEIIKDSPMFPMFFDKDGNWAVADCPIRQISLEDFVTTIPPGREREVFMRFIRRILTWDAVPRATTNELGEDEWLMTPHGEFGD